MNSAANPNTPARPLADQASRDLIVESLGESLLVEASAGTGKTTSLVSRVVAALEAGLTEVHRIALLTFTVKAAGEMKFRLRQRLDQARARASGDAARRLELAQAHLEEAYIGTIHSFCGQILRERPVEARIDPLFQEAPESLKLALIDEAFQFWLDDRLSDQSPGVRRALMRLAWSDNDFSRDDPTARLRAACSALLDWRHFDAPWRRDPFPQIELVDQLVELTRNLAILARTARYKSDDLAYALAPAQDLIAWLDRNEIGTPRQYDAVEARLLQLLRLLKQRLDKRGSGQFSSTVTREEMIELRHNLIAHLTEFRRHADADLAALLRGEIALFAPAYDRLKQDHGALDFTDLLLKTRDLVKFHRPVREFLQRRYTHLFIDEFQDTDPVMAEILLLLASSDPAQPDWRLVEPSPGKLFAVGDPKQSIYKFRQADVGLYQQIRDHVRERGARVLPLGHSFRANTNLQAAVNHAFAQAMTLTSGQIPYEPLTGFEPPIPDQPSLVVLPVPQPFGRRGVTKTAVKPQLPGIIVSWLRWLLNESNWRVRESGALVPVRPRHICLLFRKFDDYGSFLPTEYARLFEEHGIPYAVAALKDMAQRTEVVALRAVLEAIEWPGDDLAVYAALKGPFFALPDHHLFAYTRQAGRLHPLLPREHLLPRESDASGRLQPVEEALDLLAALHRGRNTRPASETITRLLNETRAHAAFALRPDGPQALASLARVIAAARAYEAEGGLSFRDFVWRIAAGTLFPEADPAVEEDFEGVQMMTVHKAKGLEFPVVVLVDIATAAQREEAERFVDPRRSLCAQKILGCSPIELQENQDAELERERAESFRIAYVAATRARDLLAVPGIGIHKLEGWLSPLDPALYPESSRQARPAPGCPPFGQTTIFDDIHSESIQPGLHRFPHHETVWWDPDLLRLPESEPEAFPQSLLIANGPDTGLQELESWRALRAADLAQGAIPSYSLMRPSQTSGEPPLAIAVEQLEIPRLTMRSGGRRFGRLVHALLESLPFDASPAAILAEAHRLAESSDDAQPAADTVAAALAHPLLIRAASSQPERELPVDLNLPDGRRLEGVIDLLFDDSGTRHIVDYKTDADASTLVDDYARQIRWYAYAVSQLTGSPVRATILSL
jgi:ATP-dependent exoDNAse (exonuclease V) beta subunit